MIYTKDNLYQVYMKLAPLPLGRWTLRQLTKTIYWYILIKNRFEYVDIQILPQIYTI
jgi:hypothetical protein